MLNYSITEATYHILISATALAFNLMLYVLQCILGTGTEDGGRRFKTLTLVTLFGNFMNILMYYTRMSVLFYSIPRAVSFFIYLLYFAINILLPYALSRYMEVFADENSRFLRLMRVVNNVILTGSMATLLFIYFWRLPLLNTSLEMMTLPDVLLVILCLVVELYYLFYVMILFISNRKKIRQRAFFTVSLGFTVTLLGILVQAVSGRRIITNYFGATLGLFLLYFSVETPDYKALSKTMQKLEEETERAESANRSKSDFLANMSHEIRTPINAVIGLNEMILRESTDEQVKAYALDVDSAGKNLLAIINDILDFSKIEAGKMEIVDAPYRLSSVINDVAVMTSFQAQSKGLTFEVEVDASLPDHLVGDEVRLRRVIANLLSNAVKYTHEGGIEFIVRGKWEGIMLVLEILVKDTGIGIRAEDLPKLFSRFDRLDMAKNNTIEGTGLGLAIAGSLTGMMGGNINVESVYGKGSTFTVILPQKVTSKEPIGDYRKRFEQIVQKSDEHKETFIAPDARVLVVDDTSVNLTVMKGLLKHTKMQIDVASSGMNALEQTFDTPYDLIFMDQRMPRMNGTQALLRIRSQVGGVNTETPVICLTADAVVGAKERYMAEGFTDYLTKPVESEALNRVLRSCLPPDKILQNAPGKDTLSEPDPKPYKTDEVGETGKMTPISRIYSVHPELSYEDAITSTMDEEVLFEVLHDFTDMIEENALQIESFLSENDIENYTIKVHALKSSTRLVGAGALSSKALKLEECGKADNKGDKTQLERIKKDTEQVLTEYRSLKDVFAPLFTDEEGQSADITGGLVEEIE